MLSVSDSGVPFGSGVGVTVARGRVVAVGSAEVTDSAVGAAASVATGSVVATSSESESLPEHAIANIATRPKIKRYMGRRLSIQVIIGGFGFRCFGIFCSNTSKANVRDFRLRRRKLSHEDLYRPPLVHLTLLDGKVGSEQPAHDIGEVLCPKTSRLPHRLFKGVSIRQANSLA